MSFRGHNEKNEFVGDPPTQEEWAEYKKPRGKRDQHRTMFPWICTECGKETDETVCLTMDMTKVHKDFRGVVMGYGVKKVCKECMKRLNPGIQELEERGFHVRF